MTFKKGNKGGKNVAEAPEAVKEPIVATEATAGAVGATPEVAAKPLYQSLGEMLYYKEYGIDMPFVNASEITQKGCVSRAKAALICLDQMDLMVVPRRDLNAERLADKKGIIETITAFFKAMNHPKNLHEVVPVEELAIRIMEGRRV